MELARHVESHEQLESTNTYAKERSHQWRLPALISADVQTAGRGRGANRWWSGSGALTFSYVLNAKEEGLDAAKWPRVSLVAALAVCEAIDARLVDCTIGVKWPNDVLVDRRKVCGILVEVAAASGQLPARLVVGIGLNVNNSLADAPLEVRGRAASLSDFAGRPIDRSQVLADVISRFRVHLNSLRTDDPTLMQRIAERSLLIGLNVQIDFGGRMYAGQVTGMRDDGSLVLRGEQGVQVLPAGVVTAIEW